MAQKNFNNISLDIPKEWLDRSVITLTAPPEKGFMPNVVVTREFLAEDKNIDDYAEEQGNMLKEELQNYKVVEEKELNLNGVDAFQRTFISFFAQANAKVQQIQTYMVKDHIAYTLTASALPETFEKNKAEFLKIMSSVKLG